MIGTLAARRLRDMGSGGVAPTLNSFDNGDVRAVTLIENNTIVRRLTPVECERLQGFPDDWTDGQADSHRYKQMGNAVTVNVAEWVGRAIMAVAHGENQT